MKVAILSGSARLDNNTIRVARAIQKELGEGVIVDYRTYDLPNANQESMHKGNLTEFQTSLVNAIDEAQLLFVLTPEYNWFPSAEIVNTVHQLASNEFRHIFHDKVAAFVGVSTGRGGRMPAVQLSYVFDKIFNVFNLHSISSPKKFESQFTTQCIDEEGVLLDNEAYNQGFKEFVQYSLNVARRWHSNT
ncbi:MAG: NAD(P)H-dependent oxidoreductase [Bacteroidia bacterium]